MSLVIWDIETISKPAEEILANIPPWDIEEAKIRVPKNYKKEEAIAGWLEQDHLGWTVSVLENAALNPETSTIAVCGFWSRDTISQLYTGPEEVDSPTTNRFQSEASMLAVMVNALMIESATFLSWNKAFDFGFFLKRCWINGVFVPKAIYNPLARYPTPERFVCLMEKWSINRGASFSKLQNVAKALGIEGKTGSGKDFGKLWQEDPAKALEYNAQDLRVTAEVAKRMGCL